MAENNIRLRCSAEGHEGSWEAICLDLDLAVQGRSFEEVYRELNEIISTYLETVSEYPAAERDRFLRRRAPLGLRLKFMLRYVVAFLFGDDTRVERHSFTATRACPA